MMNYASNQLEIEYLCSNLSDLSGIPVRIYRGKELVFSRFRAEPPIDPIIGYLDDIQSISVPVGYYSTPLFHYYGIINSDSFQIVFGPSFHMTPNIQALHRMAFISDVPKEEMDSFFTAVRSITPMPLEHFLTLLCSLNFICNQEQLTVNDIAIQNDVQETLEDGARKEKIRRIAEEMPQELPHNSYHVEQNLLRMIRKGDSAAIRQITLPPVNAGKVAEEELRQRKNIFVVAATLFSRAAIQGGMDIDDALTMSDRYIQQCEHLQSIDSINNLQFHMLTGYISHVERIRQNTHGSKLAINVANYVQKHLSEPISTEALAKELFMTRSALSTRFHKETGETLAIFITKEKIEEAKRLLRYSDRTMSQISSYLGFSSPSHFSGIFKKYTGKTPMEYRELHQ